MDRVEHQRRELQREPWVVVVPGMANYKGGGTGDSVDRHTTAGTRAPPPLTNKPRGSSLASKRSRGSLLLKFKEGSLSLGGRPREWWMVARNAAATPVCLDSAAPRHA